MVKGYIFLLSAAIFWGVTFIAQKTAMEAMGPFSFTGIRFLIGGGVLLLYKLLAIWVGRIREVKSEGIIKGKEYITSQVGTNLASKQVWHKVKSWLFLGGIVFAGINLQQIGLQFTTPTHSALLTATYIFLVPVFLLFVGEKIRKQVWFIGLLIFLGILLLTVDLSEGWELAGRKAGVFDGNLITGDIITLGSAFFWALHIIFLERYLKKGFTPLDLVMGQSLVVGLFSLFVAVVFELPHWGLLSSHVGSFVVGGVLSVSIAFLLQVKGQAVIHSSIAPLLLSTESLFATLADFLWLERVLSVQAYVGAGFILIGVVLTQVWHLVDEKVEGKKSRKTD